MTDILETIYLRETENAEINTHNEASFKAWKEELHAGYIEAANGKTSNNLYINTLNALLDKGKTERILHDNGLGDLNYAGVFTIHPNDVIEMDKDKISNFTMKELEIARDALITGDGVDAHHEQKALVILDDLIVDKIDRLIKLGFGTRDKQGDFTVNEKALSSPSFQTLNGDDKIFINKHIQLQKSRMNDMELTLNKTKPLRRLRKANEETLTRSR